MANKQKYICIYLNKKGVEKKKEEEKRGKGRGRRRGKETEG